MAQLGSTLRTSSVHKALATKELLSELELGKDEELHTQKLQEQLAEAEAFADRQAGDRVKYLAGGRQSQCKNAGSCSLQWRTLKRQRSQWCKSACRCIMSSTLQAGCLDGAPQ